MFCRTSCSVAPTETHPGKSGEYDEKPVSELSMTIRYFILDPPASVCCSKCQEPNHRSVCQELSLGLVSIHPCTGDDCPWFLRGATPPTLWPLWHREPANLTILQQRPDTARTTDVCPVYQHAIWINRLSYANYLCCARAIIPALFHALQYPLIETVTEEARIGSRPPNSAHKGRRLHGD